MRPLTNRYPHRIRQRIRRNPPRRNWLPLLWASMIVATALVAAIGA